LERGGEPDYGRLSLGEAGALLGAHPLDDPDPSLGGGKVGLRRLDAGRDRCSGGTGLCSLAGCRGGAPLQKLRTGDGFGRFSLRCREGLGFVRRDGGSLPNGKAAAESGSGYGGEDGARIHRAHPSL
jgi:hypothetical protein